MTSLWNIQAPLTYLQTLVGGLASMTGTVYQGEPVTPDSRIAAAVSIGGFTLDHQTTSTMVRWQAYWCEFYYRVGGDAAAAEAALAIVLDELAQAWQDSLTLGGTAESSRLDGSYANEPAYRNMRGPEFRTYPVVIEAKQTNPRPH